MQTFPRDFSPGPSTLKDKTILITGAASDIGAAVCRGAAQAGASILMLDRKAKDMIALYDEVQTDTGTAPLMIEFDIKKSTDVSVQQLSQSLESQLHRLDGLVHCAMWGAPLAPVVHAKTDDWQTIFNQHLIYPMMITRSLLPLLGRADSSSVIFTVLDVGRHGRAYWGGIGITFAAIENLSEILSAELENNRVRVNTLEPGKVKTALRKIFYPGESGRYLRSADDAEIVDGYLYLLSDASIHQTGQRFTVLEVNDPCITGG